MVSNRPSPIAEEYTENEKWDGGAEGGRVIKATICCFDKILQGRPVYARLDTIADYLSLSEYGGVLCDVPLFIVVSSNCSRNR